MKTALSCLLLITVMFTSLAHGQGSLQSWANVQTVGVDERLIVKQKDGKTVEGKMIEASDTNLTISRSGKVVNISRDSISQIHHSRGRAEKGKWAAIGAGVGGGVGTGIGYAKNRSIIDDGGLYVLAGAIIGAGSGAVGGLLYGASRRSRELIYSN